MPSPPLDVAQLTMQDWKCQIRFYDLSVEDDEGSSLSLNVFRPEKEMPTASCSDVILLLSVKVHSNHVVDEVALLTMTDSTLSIGGSLSDNP